ncbi:MAG: DUF6261 family protein [Flavobacteriales bacterium]
MKKIKHRKLRNSEYIQFLNDFAILCEQNTSIKEALAFALLPFIAKLAELKASSETKTNALTTQLIGLDDERDDLFVDFKGIVKHQRRHWKSSVSGAANVVYDTIIKHIPNISSLNYQAETERLETLITMLNRLESEQNVLTILKVTGWVEKLNELNTAFNSLYIERTTTDSASKKESVSNLRLESINLYEEVVSLFMGIMVYKRSINEDISDWNIVLNSINLHIDKYNDIDTLRNG